MEETEKYIFETTIKKEFNGLRNIHPYNTLLKYVTADMNGLELSELHDDEFFEKFIYDSRGNELSEHNAYKQYAVALEEEIKMQRARKAILSMYLIGKNIEAELPIREVMERIEHNSTAVMGALHDLVDKKIFTRSTDGKYGFNLQIYNY